MYLYVVFRSHIIASGWTGSTSFRVGGKTGAFSSEISNTGDVKDSRLNPYDAGVEAMQLTVVENDR